jgi:predicted RND superfamily exporter protein
MISKDAELISEAYLSALQKQKDVTTEPAMEDVAEVNPEVTDRENVEMTVAVPASPKVAMSQGPSIEPNVEDENEELWMARSNLFSLYCSAKKIHNLVQMGLDLEPWMQQKIAVAADNLEGVMKSAAYEAAEKGIDICEQN